MTLCCGANTATGQLQTETDTLNLWGANNPQWKLFAWGPLERHAAEQPDRQPDVRRGLGRRRSGGRHRAANVDGDPLSDMNGTLTLHAEAIGPGGTRKVIEVTVARTSAPKSNAGRSPSAVRKN